MCIQPSKHRSRILHCFEVIQHKKRWACCAHRQTLDKETLRVETSARSFFRQEQLDG